MLLNSRKHSKKKEIDVYLSQKLKTELSGIFNWALEGYERLSNNDFKFSKSEKMLLAKHNMKVENNSLLSFIEENFISTNNDNDKVIYRSAFEAYKNYCEESGIKNHFSKREFKKLFNWGRISS